MKRWVAGRAAGRAWVSPPWRYGAFLVMILGCLALGRDQAIGFVVFALVYLVGVALGLGYSVRAATHPLLSAASRRPWRYLAMVFCLDVVVGAAAIPIGKGAGAAEVRLSPLLVVGMVGLATQAGFLVAALLSFASRPLEARARGKLALDVVTVVGGASMILWYIVLWPAAKTGYGWVASPAAMAYDCVALFSDLASMVGVSTVVVRGTLRSVRRPVRLVLTSVIGFLCWDVWTIGSHLRGAPQASIVIGELMVTLPLFLMVAAAMEQCRTAGDRTMPESAKAVILRPSLLPYVALIVGFGVQVTATTQNGGLPWLGLVAGGAVMTFGVAARQVISLRENYDLALTDSLTGLANRVQVRMVLDRAVADSRRTGTPLAVLVIDLDGFKLVNDTHGHEAGDDLLVAFARRIRRAVRKGDVPARWGGDEFVVVLNGIRDARDAVHVAERILADADNPVIVRGGRVLIRASIGIAVTDPERPDATPEQLLHRADQAMYCAKTRVRAKRGPGWLLHGHDGDSNDDGGSRDPEAPSAAHAPRGREGAQPQRVGSLVPRPHV